VLVVVLMVARCLCSFLNVQVPPYCARVDVEPGRDLRGGPVGVASSQAGNRRGVLSSLWSGYGWGPSPWSPLIAAGFGLVCVIVALSRMNRDSGYVPAAVGAALLTVVYLVRWQVLRRRRTRERQSA
jgi:hypothetical protein